MSKRACRVHFGIVWDRHVACMATRLPEHHRIPCISNNEYRSIYHVALQPGLSEREMFCKNQPDQCMCMHTQLYHFAPIHIARRCLRHHKDLRRHICLPRRSAAAGGAALQRYMLVISSVDSIVGWRACSLPSKPSIRIMRILRYWCMDSKRKSE